MPGGLLNLSRQQTKAETKCLYHTALPLEKTSDTLPHAITLTSRPILFISHDMLFPHHVFIRVIMIPFSSFSAFLNNTLEK
jgi:hypothetical protein